MQISVEWILGTLVAFVAGGYYYTWQSNTKIWDMINKILTNHFAHFEERLDRLEKKEEGD